MRIKVRHLKLAGVAMLAVVPLVLVIVGIAQAGEAETTTVTVTTTPLRTDSPVIYDYDKDGLNEAEEFVGNFNVYDGNGTITFTWQAYSFPEGVNGSYRVSLGQYTSPFPTLNDGYVELRSNHHWADNPGSELFTMGPFGFYGEPICAYCPTIVRIEPETYEAVYDEAAQTYKHVYTPIEGATAQVSAPFIIEIFRPPVECIHSTAKYQPYWVRDPDTNSCICTLTGQICRDKFGMQKANKEKCICE